MGHDHDRTHRPVVWTMTEEELLRLLRAAHRGENPDLLYAALYAHATSQVVPGDGDEGDP